MVVVISAVIFYFTLGGNILQPILTAGSAVIAFISIFLYKNRNLQLRFNLLNVILFIFLFGMSFGSAIRQGKAINPFSYLYIVNIALTLFAFFAIKKDEDLVKSLDRIR
jgi:lipopolysaccharide export LptBFGC system permease protein LptF